MILRVSRDLAMIDPQDQPAHQFPYEFGLLSLATELTRMGLGFPQYSNDEVVIPGWLQHGYRLEDGRDYAWQPAGNSWFQAKEWTWLTLALSLSLPRLISLFGPVWQGTRVSMVSFNVLEAEIKTQVYQ